jgi:AcrR family transcriptional regulator
VNPQYDNIVEQAFKQFKQLGFKNVTMDEIARAAGISKKTLYEHFEDKDELVFVTVKKMIQAQHVISDKILKSSHNAIQKLVGILNMMESMVREMNPVCHTEMQKFYPKSYQHVENHKRDYIFKSLLNNLKQGIQEGLYREDIDVDIIAKYRLETTFMIFQNNIYPINQYDIITLNRQLFAHYLYGIATIKGHKLISKHLY